MSTMVLLLLLACALAMAVSLLASVSVHLTLSRRTPVVDDEALPPISILRPARGLDDGFEENLRALARQRYPRFEILVGAKDTDDPALAVARRVFREYPETIRIITGAPDLGMNPKVSNLAHLSRFASYDVRLISDSNVRPRPGYLRGTVAELCEPGVGLVHNHLVGEGDRSLGALFDNLHWAGWVASAVSSAKVLARHSCVVGKSMLFRQRDLDEVGGWEGVKDVLAEDYVIGQRFERAGHRVVLSPVVVPTINADASVSSFLRRHLRWAQMRRRVSAKAYAAELLGNPVPLLLVLLLLGAAGGAEAVGGLRVTVAAAFCIALKGVNDALVLIRMRGRPPPLSAVLLIPLKDVLVACLWVLGAFLCRVEWRGNVMLLTEGSVLVPYRRRESKQRRPRSFLQGAA